MSVTVLQYSKYELFRESSFSVCERERGRENPYSCVAMILISRFSTFFSKLFLEKRLDNKEVGQLILTLDNEY